MENPISIAIADLPSDFQARVYPSATHIMMRYTMFREMWTGKNGFEGDGAKERRYRYEHEAINGTVVLR